MRKTMIAAAALAALAFAALPAAASATPYVSNFKNNNRHFTVQSTPGKTAVLKTGTTKVECIEDKGVPAATGTGEFDETGETGTIQFTFHNCREKTFNSTCTGTNPGEEEAPSGTISTTALTFHLKTTTENQTPAVLITPAGGHFASFHCLGGALKVNVTGNGIVGEITAPAYNQASPTFTVEFKTSAGVQTPDKVDEEPEVTYGLEASLNGGAPKAATEEAEGTGTFTEGEPKLTETP